MNKWHIWVDGSSSGNKMGPCGAAFYARKNKVFHGLGGQFLMGSNNSAETMAILLAVKYFLKHAASEDRLTIYSDSEWASKCLAKHLQLDYLDHYSTVHYPELFAEICQLWDYERMYLTLVPREENKDADKLSREYKLKGE